LIVLDTHAWIWWVAEPARLSPRARRTVHEADEVGVPAISCWEVAMLIRHRRLTLDRPVDVWVRQALAQNKVIPLALTPEIATAAGLLDGLEGDPADRMIVATARSHHAHLVTRDRRIRDFDRALAVW
jgi:PIN domain nuclease of toxin-antitoxin system